MTPFDKIKGLLQILLLIVKLFKQIRVNRVPARFRFWAIKNPHEAKVIQWTVYLAYIILILIIPAFAFCLNSLILFDGLQKFLHSAQLSHLYFCSAAMIIATIFCFFLLKITINNRPFDIKIALIKKTDDIRSYDLIKKN